MSGKVMNKQQTNLKPFCGVCKKAGKSEQEYTSHYTKSRPGPNGVTTCPLIMAAICKCCFTQGHFADHCSKRAVKDDRSKSKTLNIRVEINGSGGKKRGSGSTSASENRFNVLRDLEDDDPVVVTVTTPAKKTFASVLASPPCAPTKKPLSRSEGLLVENVVLPVKMAKLPELSPCLTRLCCNNTTRRSWADTTDSDMEDEDEDE
jgi:hypothetical protein